MQATVAVALALGALGARAQAHRVYEYRLHEQEERGAPFGMTVGPDRTLYTIIPRRDGNWVLSRVKDWWQAKPDELGILVEGFSKNQPVADFGPMRLAVTPDGQNLVVILSAEMRVAADDPYPTDMIVEVVRLQDFTVVDTEHMRGMGIRGRLRGGLDRAGHLVVRSEIPSAEAGGSPFTTWFAVSVPQVKAQLVCSYQGGDQPGMESSCGDFAKKEGYGSASELASAVWPAPPTAPLAVPAGVSVAAKDRWQTATVTVQSKPLTLVVINGVQLQVYGQP